MLRIIAWEKAVFGRPESWNVEGSIGVRVCQCFCGDVAIVMGVGDMSNPRAEYLPSVNVHST
jgi:hypothetical protein